MIESCFCLSLFINIYRLSFIHKDCTIIHRRSFIIRINLSTCTFSVLECVGYLFYFLNILSITALNRTFCLFLAFFFTGRLLYNLIIAPYMCYMFFLGNWLLIRCSTAFTGVFHYTLSGFGRFCFYYTFIPLMSGHIYLFSLPMTT